MNVFKKYSIEEIHKRTKISPFVLNYIKNKEFSKIPPFKFKGFIRIIEREFNEDLSDLVKEYEEYLKNTTLPEKNLQQETKKNSKFPFIFGIILIIVSIIYLKNFKFKTSEVNETTLKFPVDKTQIEFNKTNELNNTKNEINKTALEINKTALEVNETKQEVNKIKLKNETKQKVNETNYSQPTLTIYPKMSLWYRIKNLDTNKTHEFLTDKNKTFFGKRFFIKFGHGQFIVEYKYKDFDKNFSPNTKKIVRLFVNEGNFTIEGNK